MITHVSLVMCSFVSGLRGLTPVPAPVPAPAGRRFTWMAGANRQGAALLCSYPQTNAAIERLVSAGILVQVTVGRRNRAFETPEITNAFTDLERQLASPDGDTRTSAPVRPVPPPKAEVSFRPTDKAK
jgi:hypothetical protein